MLFRVIRKGLIAKVSFENDLKQGKELIVSMGRVLQAEGTEEQGDYCV
jgi:hypothetical protein